MYDSKKDEKKTEVAYRSFLAHPSDVQGPQKTRVYVY